MAVDKGVLEKVGKLVALAQGGDNEESRTAAVQATKMMREHELVLVPKSEIDRVSKLLADARALAKANEGRKSRDMLVGALVGSLLLKGKL